MNARPSTPSAADRALGISLLAGVLAITLLGVAFPLTLFPRLAIFSPIALFVAVLGDIATAVVLSRTWRYSSSQRSTFVLAVSFALSAVLTLLAMLVLPPNPAVLDAPAQAGQWLYTFWHVGAALGGLAFVVLRRDEPGRAVSRRFAWLVTGVAVAFGLAAVSYVFASGERLPMLVTATSLIPFATSGVGPLVAALLAVVTLLAFCIRGPTMLDRTLAVFLLALTLDMLLLLFGGRRFTISFYASRLLVMLGGLFVLITAIQSLVASRSALWRVEGEAARRATRIRALWEIASVSATSTQERFRKMLGIAAETVRPGKAMFGGLSHLEGETVVIDALYSAASKLETLGFAATIYPGIRFPVQSSIISLLSVDRGTQAWDDLERVGAARHFSSRVLWRSLIGTAVAIGARTYFVTFASTEATTDEPFAEDDVAYVDVVASFIAGRMTQQMQFEKIQFEIEHDALTGLENRVQFREAVREEIGAGRPFTLAFANIDGFRSVNERDGYQIGDDLLVEVSAALAAVTARDLVARMSGDEFGLLLRGAEREDAALAAIGRYAEVFREPFSTGHGDSARRLGVGVSIGASRFPSDGGSFEELVRRASVALDVAKKRDGSSTVLFDTSLDAMLDESHLRFVELSDAIAGDQLALVYQPTFDLASREIVGAEALVRWDHPVRGRLAPLEFIEFAERNGLMGPLSCWVMESVARDCSRPGVSLPAGFRVYFNLGSAMLDDVPFIARFNEVLLATPGLAGRLGVEVTETAAMQNVERSVHTIELFRRWGLSVAIDDFGTGHSSLAYLKQLTVDVIKIDRSFICGLPEDERDGALTEMLLRIIDRFASVTLAEGIETEAQAAWLLAHGCRLGQGYLVARPAPFAELLARLSPAVRA